MNATTATHSTLDDGTLVSMSSEEESLGVASTHDLESDEAFFRRFAFPDSKPVARPFEFADFVTDADRRLLLEDLADTQLVIEIGSLLGGSTRFLLEANPTRRVICVDPWERTYPDCLPQFTSGEQIYQTFLANLWEFHDRIAVMRMPSRQALPMIADAGLAVEAVYIDGDHAYEAVWNDLCQASQRFPAIRIVGDDFGPGFHGVTGACLDFATETNRPLLVDGDAWEMGSVVTDRIAVVLFAELGLYRFWG